MSDARCLRTSAHSRHSGLICATHDSESRDRRGCGSASCAVACRECVSAARTHAHTHTRAHAHTQAHARAVGALAHPGSRVHEERAHRHTGLGSSGCPHLRQDWAHPHLDPVRDCAAATTVHLHRDCASLPGTITSFVPCHVCTRSGLVHSPHLQRDLTQPSLRSCRATYAPGLRSPSDHICAGTALAL